MKRSTCNQVQDLAGTPDTTFEAKTKYVTAVIFEREGKTVLQPLITEQEAETIQGLFRSKTLEVWLSNGKSEFSAFDVAILKYKQLSQSLTKCSKVANQRCLKNLFKSIVSCEQCPLSGDANEN